jgi:FkbM family methyltransferase
VSGILLVQTECISKANITQRKRVEPTVLKTSVLQTKSPILQRLKTLSHFGFGEIIVLLTGKILDSGRLRSFKRLQHKENSLHTLYTEADSVEISDDLAKIIYRIGNDVRILYLRLSGSDVWVFRQILLNEEYREVINVFRERFKRDPEKIIDAGSNIGLVTMFFKSLIPRAQVLAIEPDAGNFEIARRNITANVFDRVTLRQAALWPEKKQLAVISDFRDGKEWSLRVEENEEGSIEGLTPREAVVLFDNEVDIFKIDIEGAEAKLFNPNTDLSWLDHVRVITLEIHEEFGKIENIIALLTARGFEVSSRGELSIGVNTKWLN